MKEMSSRKFAVKLSFEETRLPPFEDILILGKRCSQGKIGVYKSMELLMPNEFETLTIEDEIVETIFVNKRILKKLDKDKIIAVLRENVFPYISECEILKVDFKIRFFYDSIRGGF